MCVLRRGFVNMELLEVVVVMRRNVGEAVVAGCYYTASYATREDDVVTTSY